MKYELPVLPYRYDALEPIIDARTMEIHHTKHHQAYTDKLNAVLEKYPSFAQRPLADLLREIDVLEIEEADRKALRNNGGGYLNHSLFWQIMDPAATRDEALVAEIEQTFGTIDEFKAKFTETALGRFGSGWAWLVRSADDALKVYSTANQDSPLMKGDMPIIGLDVWEHAYYLQYQNRRPEYIEQWWNVVKLI